MLASRDAMPGTILIDKTSGGENKPFLSPDELQLAALYLIDYLKLVEVWL